jgi:thioredoxin-like negative regulator of GroEL
MRAVGLLSGSSPRRRISTAGELARSGDPAGAVEQLAAVLDEEPEDVAANVEMARALMLLDDPAAAEEHYRRALAVRVDYKLVIELAQTLAAQGRLDDAEDHLDAARQMTESDRKLDAGEVHLARAMLYAGEGRAADAREALAQIPSNTSRSVRDFAARIEAGLGG